MEYDGAQHILAEVNLSLSSPPPTLQTIDYLELSGSQSSRLRSWREELRDRQLMYDEYDKEDLLSKHQHQSPADCVSSPSAQLVEEMLPHSQVQEQDMSALQLLEGSDAISSSASVFDWPVKLSDGNIDCKSSPPVQHTATESEQYIFDLEDQQEPVTSGADAVFVSDSAVFADHPTSKNDSSRYIDVTGMFSEDFCMEELTGGLNISAMLEGANDVEDSFWDPESCSVDTENTDIDDVEDVSPSRNFSENQSIIAQERPAESILASVDHIIDNNEEQAVNIDSHHSLASDLEVINTKLSAAITSSDNQLNANLSMTADSTAEDSHERTSHRQKKKHQNQKTSPILPASKSEVSEMAEFDMISGSWKDVVAPSSHVVRNASSSSAQVNRNRSYTKAIDFCDVDTGGVSGQRPLSASLPSTAASQPDTTAEQQQQQQQNEESVAVVPRHKSYLKAVELAEDSSANQEHRNQSCTVTTTEQIDQSKVAAENFSRTADVRKAKKLYRRKSYRFATIFKASDIQLPESKSMREGKNLPAKPSDVRSSVGTEMRPSEMPVDVPPSYDAVVTEENHDFGVEMPVDVPPSHESVTMKGNLELKVSHLNGKRFGYRSWRKLYAVLRGNRLELNGADATIAMFLEQPLSLESCQVDIVYDYRNRKNVFRLVTPSRSSFLFDTDDESVMHRWISAIGAARSRDVTIDDRSGAPSQVPVESHSARLLSAESGPADNASQLVKPSAQAQVARAATTKTKPKRTDAVKSQSVSQQPSDTTANVVKETNSIQSASDAAASKSGKKNREAVKSQTPSQQSPVLPTKVPSNSKSSSAGGQSAAHATSSKAPPSTAATGDSSTKNPEKVQTKETKTWRARFAGKFRTAHASLDIGTFGIPLDKCIPSPNNKYLPLIVEVCIRKIEENGLANKGIYRVPGNASVVTALQADIEKDPVGLNLDSDKWQDVNVVVSIFKLFFRKLPESLATDALYPQFVAANNEPVMNDKIRKIHNLLHRLPPHNLATFHAVAKHLHAVASYESENMMNTRSLSVVFAPTLLQPRDSSMLDMVKDMSAQCQVLEAIVIYHERLFRSYDETDNCASSTVDIRLSAAAEPVTQMDQVLLEKAEIFAAAKEDKDSEFKKLLRRVASRSSKSGRKSRSKSAHSDLRASRRAHTPDDNSGDDGKKPPSQTSRLHPDPDEFNPSKSTLVRKHSGSLQRLPTSSSEACEADKRLSHMNMPLDGKSEASATAAPKSSSSGRNQKAASDKAEKTKSKSRTTADQLSVQPHSSGHHVGDTGMTSSKTFSGANLTPDGAANVAAEPPIRGAISPSLHRREAPASKSAAPAAGLVKERNMSSSSSDFPRGVENNLSSTASTVPAAAAASTGSPHLHRRDNVSSRTISNARHGKEENAAAKAAETTKTIEVSIAALTDQAAAALSPLLRRRNHPSKVTAAAKDTGAFSVVETPTDELSASAERSVDVLANGAASTAVDSQTVHNHQQHSQTPARRMTKRLRPKEATTMTKTGEVAAEMSHSSAAVIELVKSSSAIARSSAVGTGIVVDVAKSSSAVAVMADLENVREQSTVVAESSTTSNGSVRGSVSCEQSRTATVFDAEINAPPSETVEAFERTSSANDDEVSRVVTDSMTTSADYSIGRYHQHGSLPDVMSFASDAVPLEMPAAPVFRAMGKRTWNAESCSWEDVAVKADKKPDVVVKRDVFPSSSSSKTRGEGLGSRDASTLPLAAVAKLDEEVGKLSVQKRAQSSADIVNALQKSPVVTLRSKRTLQALENLTSVEMDRNFLYAQLSRMRNSATASGSGKDQPEISPAEKRNTWPLPRSSSYPIMSNQARGLVINVKPERQYGKRRTRRTTAVGKWTATRKRTMRQYGGQNTREQQQLLAVGRANRGATADELTSGSLPHSTWSGQGDIAGSMLNYESSV